MKISGNWNSFSGFPVKGANLANSYIGQLPLPYYISNEDDQKILHVNQLFSFLIIAIALIEL